MKTVDDILIVARERYHQSGRKGNIYRSDILELLEGTTEPERGDLFHQLIESAEFLTPQEKMRIERDYDSY